MSQLLPTDLEKFIAENGINARLIPCAEETPTVPDAAAALGVEPDQIIKTLLFVVQRPMPADTTGIDPAEYREHVVIISNGESRVDKHALSAHFEVGKKRVKLASAETVLTRVGFPPGGVPPFGHRTKLPVLLDESVLTQRDRPIFGGGGDDQTMLELTVDELIRVVEPMVLAVSDGWQ